MGETEERVVRVEIQRQESKATELERQIRIEIPADTELSEEEMKKIASATENEIVEVIRGAQAKELAARVLAKTVKQKVTVQGVVE